MVSKLDSLVYYSVTKMLNAYSVEFLSYMIQHSAEYIRLQFWSSFAKNCAHQAGRETNEDVAMRNVACRFCSSDFRRVRKAA